MLINEQNVELAFRGFKATFDEGALQAETYADKIAMTIPSSTREEQYGWLGTMPNMREWIGPRHVNSLQAHGFALPNIDYESTVEVKRNDMEDDRLGVYAPLFRMMGLQSKQHPEQLVWPLLKRGFETLCYDGQNFFDEDHPVLDGNGAPVSVSNMQTGSDPAWYLVDARQPIKPIVFQQRTPYTFESMTEPNNPRVFETGRFLFGVRARVNVGFGLWQTAFGSKAALTPENYALARAAMMAFKADGGRVLGIKPTMLICPPELEEDALKIVNAATGDAGASNVWAGTAEPLVVPWLA